MLPNVTLIHLIVLVRYLAVTIQCDAARSLFCENVSDFVRILKFLTGHGWKLALVCLSPENLIG